MYKVSYYLDNNHVAFKLFNSFSDVVKFYVETNVTILEIKRL